MAGVQVFTFIFLYFSIYIAKADECVTYNFENDINSRFLNGVCGGMLQGLTPWSVGRYSAIEIEKPYENSVSFISPSSTLSCGSTFVFKMTAGGTLEINVYMESSSMVDQISVIAMQSVTDGTDIQIGVLMRSPSDSTFTNGWQTLSIDVAGSGSFDGYMSFTGVQSADSVLLIDSFRYIPPGLDADLCVIYEDSTEITSQPTTETTVESTTETTTSSTILTEPTTLSDITIQSTTENLAELTALPTTTAETTVTDTTITSTAETTNNPTTFPTTETTFVTIPGNQDIDTIEECVTMNFESDFDVNFSTDNYLCDGFLPWQLDNYTSIDIESPNSASTAFMAPHEYTSCLSSHVFKMEPGGTVEATVYMEPVQTLDHIILIAQRVIENGFDTVAGFVKYHPRNNEIFVPGWNVISFNLLDLVSFDGYLIFIGSADSSSTVLVDSVRYIPPQTPIEDSSCNIY